MLRNNVIDETVEAICKKGCKAVRDDLAILKQGKTLVDTEHLNFEERRAVYKELKSIIVVYGDACAVEGKVKTQSPKLTSKYWLSAFLES